jgi:hypothetical protein
MEPNQKGPYLKKETSEKSNVSKAFKKAKIF